MSQHPATWLASALRGGGCRVKTYTGWMTRGRPATSGGFNPQGILLHHTGTPTSMKNPAPTVQVCINGRPDLPGPLCQMVLGFDGLFHVIAAGRANHAGGAKPSGPIPGGDGNELYLGIEIDYSGSQDMGKLQYSAMVKGCAAILKKMGLDASHVRGHKETSSAGKWDPGRHGSSSAEYLMAHIRADIARALKPPPPPPDRWAVEWTDDDGVRHKDDTATITGSPARFYITHRGAFKRASVFFRPVRP